MKCSGSFSVAPCVQNVLVGSNSSNCVQVQSSCENENIVLACNETNTNCLDVEEMSSQQCEWSQSCECSLPSAMPRTLDSDCLQVLDGPEAEKNVPVDKPGNRVSPLSSVQVTRNVSRSRLLNSTCLQVNSSEHGVQHVLPVDNVNNTDVSILPGALNPRQKRLLKVLQVASADIVRTHARLKNLNSEGNIQSVIRRIINHCK